MLPMPCLPGASWLLMQQEVPDATNLAAANAARLHGVKTILNAAASPLSFPDALNGLVDILVVNEIEAEAMGARAIDSLAAAGEAATGLLRFAEATVVTAGAAGVAIASGRRASRGDRRPYAGRPRLDARAGDLLHRRACRPTGRRRRSWKRRPVTPTRRPPSACPRPPALTGATTRWPSAN